MLTVNTHDKVKNLSSRDLTQVLVNIFENAMYYRDTTQNLYIIIEFFGEQSCQKYARIARLIKVCRLSFWSNRYELSKG